MVHNFSIEFSVGNEKDILEIQANSLEDAMIQLYEINEDAVFIDYEIDINPASFEPETDTITAAIESRKNR